MVLLECARRPKSVPAMLMIVVACAATPLFGQPLVVTPRVQASFQQQDGQVAESAAVPVGDDPILVVVTGPGVAPVGPRLRIGARELPVKVMGYDPVSRLAFLKVEGDGGPKALEWAADAGGTGRELQAMDATGPMKCRATGWVKQVGGKILPFALLAVDFQKAAPPAGTPVLDGSGRVMGVVFQGAGNSGYVIPAEAVHRVRRDVCDGGGKLVRGWLGLALRAETGAPKISRVVDKSPSSAAGIRTDDLIVSIGTRAVADYADAANAFFYLVPGEPVKVKVTRAGKALDFTLTPGNPPG